jgi:hypothetical protein
MLSRRTIASARRQRSSSADWRKRLTATRNRKIAFEPLEDRRLLSVGAVQPVDAGPAALLANHSAAAEPVSLAAATASASLAAAATSAVSDASTDPTIGQVVVSQTSGRISWNVLDATPVATTTLQIDGKTVSDIAGPFSADSGVNFSASIASLAVGLHSYIITATDTAGNASSITNTFTISDTVTASSTPTIGNVVVSQSTGRISWNVLASTTISFSTLSVDNVSIPYVSGPFTAASGVNFSAPLTILAAGAHTLTITATDKANATASLTQPFTITPTGPGPVISSVVVSASTDTITWNAADLSGVAGSTLKIDGVSITPVGPIGTPASADFSASLGLLNAGPHTLVITATNTLNQVSVLNTNFILDSNTSVGPTISQVVASEAKARISWNAFDTSGVTGNALSIDGNAVSNISGPFSAASGVNFSAPLDSLAAGLHTYAITSFDGLGSQRTASGTFTLLATTTYDPMISMVVIAQARARISWNVFSPNTVVGSTLQIDGVIVGNVLGPFAASSGVNFSAPLASLAAGGHTYRITATDNLGRVSAVVANFNLAAPTSASAGALRNAVFSSIAESALANSAKADWMVDI